MSCAKYRRKNIVDDVDTTKQSPITRPVITLSYAQTFDGRLATSARSSQWISAPESSVTRYGVDLVINGRIEYPGTPPMTVGSEERVGCVTA
jgi:hypothetical protein